MEMEKKELNQLSAQRLNLLLEEKNMKQKELASLIYVTEQTVSNWIKGHKRISEDNAERIVNILADNPDYMTVNWLLGKSDYRSEQEYLNARNWAEQIKEAYPVYKLNNLANSIIWVIFDYQKAIIPLDDNDMPLIDESPQPDFPEYGLHPKIHYQSVDFSNESVERYAIATVSLTDNSILGNYDVVFERNELATIIFEIVQTITNKIQFEILCHSKRFSEGVIFDNLADKMFNLGEQHAEEE